jgi:hypothetical protein
MTLTALLDILNNRFEREYQDGTFTIADNAVSKVNLTCPIGSYVAIEGSVLNDGVYKVSYLTDGSLGLDATLGTEVFTGTVISLSVPKEVVSLCDDITSYEKKNNQGITSESIPNYSVSFDQSSAKVKFQSRLGLYQKPFMGKEYYRKWATSKTD